LGIISELELALRGDSAKKVTNLKLESKYNIHLTTKRMAPVIEQIIIMEIFFSVMSNFGLKIIKAKINAITGQF